MNNFFSNITRFFSKVDFEDIFLSFGVCISLLGVLASLILLFFH